MHFRGLYGRRISSSNRAGTTAHQVTWSGRIREYVRSGSIVLGTGRSGSSSRLASRGRLERRVDCDRPVHSVAIALASVGCPRATLVDIVASAVRDRGHGLHGWPQGIVVWGRSVAGPRSYSLGRHRAGGRGAAATIERIHSERRLAANRRYTGLHRSDG